MAIARFAGLLKPLAKAAKLSASRTFTPGNLATSAAIDMGMNAGFGFAFSDGDFGQRLDTAFKAATAPESLATLVASPIMRWGGGTGDVLLGRQLRKMGYKDFGSRVAAGEGALSLGNMGDMLANIATPAIVSSIRNPAPPKTIEDFAAQGVDPIALYQLSQDPRVMEALIQASGAS
ncbi:hypothetical protein [Synechococcus elongatus]|uniref:hypothetical protein n=1 Tax=Synechococcus elongatus TaxID=32046 RepID=UPI000F7D5EBD|nr:hypothetical protein [Synechococcus elongatus]